MKLLDAFLALALTLSVFASAAIVLADVLQGADVDRVNPSGNNCCNS